MRAHGLLSPHRGRQGAAKTHDGRVITQAPNVMWGTDGVRVFTLDDGWGWIFAAVEHWNAECVGWHVCKVGSRFAALDPIAQGLGRAAAGGVFGPISRGRHAWEFSPKPCGFWEFSTHKRHGLQTWRLEKLGYHTPIEAREEYELRQAATPNPRTTA